MSDTLTTLYFVVGAIPGAFLLTIAAAAFIGMRVILSGGTKYVKPNNGQVESALKLKGSHFILWAIFWSVVHFFIWPISIPVCATIAAIRRRKAKKNA